MTIQLKPCTLSDVRTLQAISMETFDETFRATNKPENLDAYLEKAFTLEKLEKELANPDSFFYFAYAGEELAGYLKVNINAAHSDEIMDDALEVERIYIRRAYQGQGLGKYLIQKSIDIAKEKSSRTCGWGCGRRTRVPSDSIKGWALFCTERIPFTWGMKSRRT